MHFLVQDPHAFEKLTAEHLRKAYAQGLQRKDKLIILHPWKINMGILKIT